MTRPLSSAAPATNQPIADEDEFEQAVAAYDLTPEFQASCYRTVEEVTALIRTWVPLGLP